MILIALGSNLPSPVGPPRDTVEAALARMGELGIEIVARSHWYRTSPVPPSGQPDFVNGVVAVRTTLGPHELLATLHRIEAELGRTRAQKWEARVLDLDLLAYDDKLILEELQNNGQSIQIPHPRLHERRFVLVPLAEIAPEWVHPARGQTARELLAGLKDGDRVDRLPE
jgi:2-amino-4-hydroxy-6-hydroxymethyldihydropteridine diphosphokinase